MARTQQQKTESRRAILQSASRLFREKGVDAVSVAEIMEGAGLTHGGFPRHFESKQALVTEALADVLAGNGVDALPADLDGFLKLYLRPEHRDAPGAGCIFAALGSEMSRAPDETRHRLTAAIAEQIDRFEATAPGKTPEEKRAAAITAWAAAIGAMTLARIADDAALSEEILAAARNHLLGPAQA